MAVTRLQRKTKRNKIKAKQRIASLKRLLATPVIKNVDIEEIKASFKTKEKAPAKAATNTTPKDEE